ncbi:hypothetical protein [Flavobacterium sp. UBA6135]|uniref:hypothetical protein n=1 Tax=Flavobacterium sp. UBA6135 TaxID=1946553 RepID=UPI0025BA4FA3|nr:hypothetical protein [Flavobacterium sp. UBA6135]
MNFFKFNTFPILAFLLVGILVSCEDDSSSSNPLASQNFVSFETNKTVLIETGQTVAIEAKVFASQTSTVDRVLELVVGSTSTANPMYYSMPSTVTIPAGSKEGTINLSIQGVELDSTGKTIVIGFVPQEGLNVTTTYSGSKALGTYAVAYKQLVITAKEVCSASPLRIQIVTDRYGDETTWELYNQNMDVIASGGPYATQSASGAFPQAPIDLCLASGSYTFVVYDSYGDGMNSGYGAGYYRLVSMNSDFSSEVLQIAQNGVFGAFDIVEFTLQ